MKSIIFLLAALIAVRQYAHAKAYFQTESELVTQSTAIAIIELSDPVDSDQKGGTWTYRKSASAKVIDRVAGTIPDTFTLFGDETFICAQCHLVAGRYLAFLRRDGDLWAGANWNLSLRPLKENMIEWYTAPERRFPMTFQPRANVIGRVRELLSKKKQEPKKASSQPRAKNTG
ncbi:MAG: hypothetical protein ACKV19_22755 [Verrucomicrobiales bacterium]